MNTNNTNTTRSTIDTKKNTNKFDNTTKNNNDKKNKRKRNDDHKEKHTPNMNNNTTVRTVLLRISKITRQHNNHTAKQYIMNSTENNS